MHVMILGGTARGRQLAEVLDASGIDVLSCLAGRTESHVPLPGRVRVGGFGGTDGLVAFLADDRPAALVDATHPFAATMSHHAYEAAQRTRTPALRLQAPSWAAQPDATAWTWAASHEEAGAELMRVPGRVVLTVGRQELPAYYALGPRDAVARVVDPPKAPAPHGWRILRSRGPFQLAGERELLAGPPAAAALVSKDSGGAELDPKLVAARELGVRVVMVRRPPPPAWSDEVTTVAAAAAWLRERRLI